VTNLVATVQRQSHPIDTNNTTSDIENKLVKVIKKLTEKPLSRYKW
jgi:hypothetical protein